MIEEGLQVTFECGHTMVYQQHSLSLHGTPEVGQEGTCRQCGKWPVQRTVTEIRQCWVETTVKVHFVKPPAEATGHSPR